MTASVLQVDRPTGHGRQPQSVELLRDLADEVRALHAERADLADEIDALARRAQIAIWNDRPDIVLSIAGRLDALAASLRRRNAA